MQSLTLLQVVFMGTTALEISVSALAVFSLLRCQIGSVFPFASVPFPFHCYHPFPAFPKFPPPCLFLGGFWCPSNWSPCFELWPQPLPPSFNMSSTILSLSHGMKLFCSSCFWSYQVKSTWKSEKKKKIKLRLKSKWNWEQIIGTLKSFVRT